MQKILLQIIISGHKSADAQGVVHYVRCVPFRKKRSFGSWAAFRKNKFLFLVVFCWIFGTMEIKLLLAERQTFWIMFAKMSSWRNVSSNLWMHISLGRRNNHVTNLRKFGVYFGVLHAMVHLDSSGRTTDGRTTDGQRTDMNEVGSLYIGAFGTKIIEKYCERC